MDHFVKFAAFIPTSPILLEIRDKWDTASPELELRKLIDSNVSSLECKSTPEWDQYPVLMNLVFDTARFLRVTRMGKISLHQVEPASMWVYPPNLPYDNYYNRFIIPLIGGGLASCSNEERILESIELEEGHLYWWNNRLFGSLNNHIGDSSMLSLVMDFKR